MKYRIAHEIDVAGRTWRPTDFPEGITAEDLTAYGLTETDIAYGVRRGGFEAETDEAAGPVVEDAPVIEEAPPARRGKAPASPPPEAG